MKRIVHGVLVSLFFVFPAACSEERAVTSNPSNESVPGELLGVQEFITLYNHPGNASVRVDSDFLVVRSIQADRVSFAAIGCRHPHACSEEEQRQPATDYRLEQGDVNNDGIAELAFVAVNQGSDLGDVILAVYQLIDGKLKVLPFEETVLRSLGDEALRQWPYRLGDPFLSRENGEQHMNFVSRLVWRDALGKVVSRDRQNEARHGEIVHYRYLWKSGVIKLVDTRKQVVEREAGP